jgi:hypothetical protein
MNVKSFRLLPQLVAIILSFSLLWGGGCGGGTRGSGGQFFEGLVSDSNSRSLSGVTVTIFATGDSAVTDENGSFEIQTTSVSGAVEFLLESGSFSGKVATENVPQDAKRIFVSFVVGVGMSPPIRVDVDVREREPTPTPRPTSTPIAAPSVAPGVPTQIPTPAPTTSGGSGSTGGSDDRDDDDDDSGGRGPGDDGGDDDDSPSTGGSGATGGSGPTGGSGSSGSSGGDEDDDDDDGKDGDDDDDDKK